MVRVLRLHGAGGAEVMQIDDIPSIPAAAAAF
jgi:hypothetical protein